MATSTSRSGAAGWRCRPETSWLSTATGWSSYQWHRLLGFYIEQAERLLTTEHILQEKIKAGATIGELINVDEVFRHAFSYQKERCNVDEQVFTA